MSPVLVHECGRSFEAVTPPGDMHVWHAVNSCKSQIILLVQLYTPSFYAHTQHTHTHTHTHTLCAGVSVMAEGVGGTRGASSLPEVSGGQDSDSWDLGRAREGGQATPGHS